MIHSHICRALLLCAILLGLVPSAGQAAGDTVLFVRAGAQGKADGTSWADAYTDVQVALAAATPGSAIWVATGTYTPSSTDRTASFMLKQDVAIYGGFAGTETELTARDWQVNATILSGDLAQNDTSDGANSGENSYRVVQSLDLTANTRIDGFIISNGNANGDTFPNNCGGGMFNFFSNPTVSNVAFTRNNAITGGGMYNSVSSPTLTNVTFSSNTATIEAGEFGGGGNGGGMANDGDRTIPKLINVTFSGNTAAREGGGMFNVNGTRPILTSVTLSGNQASNYGGGMSNNSSNPTLTDVTLSGNHSSTHGGGMSNQSSDPTLTNVIISGNQAAIDGGGMHNYSSNPTLVNVTLSGNQAGLDGGAIFASSSSPTLTNVILSGNQAAFGGGMYTYNGSPKLVNVTLSGNRASFEGGGIYKISSLLSVRNSIIWGNAPGAITGDAADVHDSLIQGGYVGTGNLAVDPQFLTSVDSSSAPTSVGDLRLRPSSPAIDAGDDSALPAAVSTDRDGNPRCVDVPEVGNGSTRTVDLGAYEAPVLRVAVTAPLDANPTSAAQVRFRLTFTSPVTGVDPGDLHLTSVGVHDAAVVAVVGGGTVYTVTVNTGIGVGTLRLDVPESATIADTYGYPVSGLPYTSGTPYMCQSRTVDPITFTATPNPATPEQVITLTARVVAANGTPQGTISFRDGANLLGSAPLDATGLAVLTSSNLSVGTHTLVAVYSGDGSFAGSVSNPLSLVVQPRPLTPSGRTVYLPLVHR